MYNATERFADLNKAGYDNAIKLAYGLVAVSATDVIFEGDVNQDGNVDSIRYTLQADKVEELPPTF